MTEQWLSIHGKPIYEGNPVSHILSNSWCLCCYNSKVFLSPMYTAFLGTSSLPYPIHSFEQYYLQESTITHSHNMDEVSKALFLYLIVYSFYRWRDFLMSSLSNLSLHMMSRISLRHVISNTFCCCCDKPFTI